MNLDNIIIDKIEAVVSEGLPCKKTSSFVELNGVKFYIEDLNLVNNFKFIQFLINFSRTTEGKEYFAYMSGDIIFVNAVVQQER